MTHRATVVRRPVKCIAVSEAALLDHLATAVLVLDRRLDVAWLNSAAEALLAVSANQVLGAQIGAVLPELRAHRELLERALEEGQSLTEREMSLTVPGGVPAKVDFVATPIDPREGGPALVIELLDLDRRQQVSREQRMRSEQEATHLLVRGLAHELRNPLGGLRGAAQLLERELGDAALREYTEVIVSEADRMQNLLDRMLGPRQPPTLRCANVHELTERVCALIAAEAPPRVRLQRDYDPSLPEIAVDADMLIQALLNVSRNALQAVGENGTVTVRTRIERNVVIADNRYRMAVRVDIEDDGEGVPAELREQIFFPMVTGRSEGTGLGLSIAQRLVSRHGGTIECISDDGCTVFRLLLPVERAAGEPR